ncbi:MAG: BatA domain-containing protein [Chitinophagales bacterium]
MEFVYPTFLYALAALAIPIIIHLFNFRRFKKVYFTNVRFLKEVKEETASRNKLKHLLILLSRLLALAFLVLAFAQPFIPNTNSEFVQGTKAVSIFLDNSYSMEAESSDVSLFEKAKLKAREIVESYGVEDRFQIITNDFEGKHQRMLNKDEFLSYLEEIEVSPNVQNLSEVISRQKQAMSLESAAQNNVFLVSDFQKNIVDIAADSSINTYLIPLQSAEQRNVYVDSIWFESPIRMLNTVNKLLVRLNNTGEAEVENSQLTLKINDQIKALNNFTIGAKSQLVDTVSFTITQTGWHNSELSISDYPINFDDTYYFTFDVAENIKVLAINQSGVNPYLNALFKGSSEFDFQNQSYSQLDYDKLPQNQLIILNQLQSISSGLASKLQQYVEEGGSILVFPSDDIDLTSYNNFLKAVGANTFTAVNREQRQIDFINTQQEIFNDVFEKIPRNIDLPFARLSYDMTSFSNTDEEIVLKFKGGRSFLSKYNVGSGKVYVASASLNIKQNNLPSHAIFVPMLYKIALLGSKSMQLAYTIGKDEVIEVATKVSIGETPFKLKGETEEFIPGQRVVGSNLLLTLNNALKNAGIYEIYMQENQPLSYLGFNFNRQESILDYWTEKELKDQFTGKNMQVLDAASIGTTVVNLDKGKEYWKICLMLVLLFLAIEILLLRLWKS